MNVPEADRKIHPGWAIQFADKSWLGCAHGYFAIFDCFYAQRFESEQEAKQVLQDMKEDGWEAEGQVVLAWEPYCASLLFKIEDLKRANLISPSKLFDVKLLLQDSIDLLSQK